MVLKNKWLIKLIRIFAIVLVLLILGFQQGKIMGYSLEKTTDDKQKKRPIATLEQIKVIFDKAHAFSEDDWGQVTVFNKNEEKIGYVLSSKPYSDSLVGFAGPVHFIIGIDNANKVVGLELTEHNESPGYIRFIETEGFFKKLLNRSINDIVEQKIDAVSGATLTCDAVSIALKKRLAAHSDIILKTKTNNIKKKIGQLFSLVVVIFALLSFFYLPLRKYRLFLLIGSVVVLGFYQGLFISIYLIYNWSIIGVPLFSQWLISGILIVSILLPLIFNKSFYCNYLCPYGAAQELACRLTSKKYTIPYRNLKVIKNFRGFIFLILCILIISGFSIDLTNVEPFTAFIFQSASIAVIVLALVFLLLSLFFQKPWCYYFCPTGQFLAFFRISKKNM